jgi:hypothetical protein
MRVETRPLRDGLEFHFLDGIPPLQLRSNQPVAEHRLDNARQCLHADEGKALSIE